MKLIFLDIDGVLNSEIFFQYRYEHLAQDKMIDQCAVRHLVNLCQMNTNVRIVLSSSWRQGDISLTKQLLCRDHEDIIPLLPYIIDETPYRYDRNRGKEIKQWLDHCNINVEKYVILDDDDFDIEDENLIKIDPMTGLYGKYMLRLYRKLDIEYLY